MCTSQSIWRIHIDPFSRVMRLYFSNLFIRNSAYMIAHTWAILSLKPQECTPAENRTQITALGERCSIH